MLRDFGYSKVSYTVPPPKVAERADATAGSCAGRFGITSSVCPGPARGGRLSLLRVARWPNGLSHRYSEQEISPSPIGRNSHRVAAGSALLHEETGWRVASDSRETRREHHAWRDNVTNVVEFTVLRMR